MARLALRTLLYRKGVTATHFMCGVGDKEGARNARLALRTLLYRKGVTATHFMCGVGDTGPYSGFDGDTEGQRSERQPWTASSTGFKMN